MELRLLPPGKRYIPRFHGQHGDFVGVFDFPQVAKLHGRVQPAHCRKEWLEHKEGNWLLLGNVGE
jgi:hypothetical protein